MLSFSFVTDTSLLYFVVICMLILCSVIHHDKPRLNSCTRISINAAYLLLLHSVAYAVFCILFYVTDKYHLGNVKGIRFALVIVGLLTNYMSFVYPYILLYLIRRFYSRNTYVRGSNFRLFSTFFILCTLMTRSCLPVSFPLLWRYLIFISLSISCCWALISQGEEYI